jgi:hypothetical protein
MAENVRFREQTIIIKYNLFKNLMKVHCSLIFGILFSANSIFGQNLVINEFLSSNGKSLTDYNGKYEDWIELYNSGTASINLSGYRLSDNLLNPSKWTFPAVTINSGQFLVIFASGNNTVYPNQEIHTSFSMNASGEHLILTDPFGTLVDQTDSVNLEMDISYGRKPDGSGPWYYFQTPTPGASNINTSYSGFLAVPLFPASGGFYTNSFNLTLTNSDPAAVIRYTLDGSEPVDTSFIYSSPLLIKSRKGDPNHYSLIPTAFPSIWDVPTGEIEKVTVVRAKVFKSGSLSSGVVTNTYFVDNNIKSRYDVPVISLTTNKENFFDYLTGINVPGKIFDNYSAAYPDTIFDGGSPANYTQPGKAWEKPVNIEYFESNGTLGFNQKMGVDIHGNYSRVERQKSYNLLPSKDYDTKDLIDYPLFPGLTKQSNGKPLNKFNTVMIRNGGSDWGGSMMRDAFVQSLVSHTKLDIQAFRPIVLFFDGEYWGMYEMREKPDKYYFANNYEIDKDSVVILEGYDLLAEGPSGGENHYKNILSYVGSGNMTGNNVFDYLNTQMDIDNYADYFTSQIYWNNGDWPGNNVKFWRKNVPYNPNASYGQDGRWRWLIYDADFAFGFWNFVTIKNWSAHYSFNTLDFATKAGLTDWPNPDWSTYLFRKMLTNPTFKNLFINRMADHLNSSFRESRVKAKLDETSHLMVHEMPNQVYRWKAPGSVTYWNSHLNDMSAYAIYRPTYVRQHVVSQFGLSGTVNVKLEVSDPAHGKIKINSLLISENTIGVTGEAYPWTGIYFQGVPVSIEAIPEKGFRFVRWEGSNVSTEGALSLTMSSDQSLKAIFESDENISVFPNPTAGSFFIEVDNLSNGNGSVKIYDMMGKEIYRNSFYKSQFNFKIPVDIAGNSISMGVYIVQVELGGKFYRKKFLMER